MFLVDPDNSHLLVGGVPDGLKVPKEVLRVNYQGAMDGVKIDFAPVGLWDAEVENNILSNIIALKTYVWG